MNEFMVWFPKMGRFLDKSDSTLDCLLDVRNGKRVFNIQEIVEDDGYVLLPYIGLNDIDGNKIYADSSIVEFDFINIIKETVKIIGYFSYSREELQYKFYQYLEQRNKFIPAYLNPKDSRYPNGFKIVDTLQENKLGLIK